MNTDQDPMFETLLDHLKRSRGFDFTVYKRPSLMRRVLKRMQAVEVEDFADYMDRLEVHPDEFTQLFNTILDEEGLKKDREGQPRTAYSLRHTYICLRLMEGADIYQIAKNCRTSVEMIEKYYASHLKNSLDAAAINIRRPKTKKKNEPPPEQEG